MGNEPLDDPTGVLGKRLHLANLVRLAHRQMDPRGDASYCEVYGRLQLQLDTLRNYLLTSGHGGDPEAKRARIIGYLATIAETANGAVAWLAEEGLARPTTADDPRRGGPAVQGVPGE